MSSESIQSPSTCVRRGRVVAGLAATLFGIATVVEGSKMLMAGPEARAAADVVMFVLLFNVAAAPLYLAVGAATLAGRPIAKRGAVLLAVSTAAVYGAFWLHVLTGGVWSGHTARAMAVRTVFWVILSVAMHKRLFADTDTCELPPA